MSWAETSPVKERATAAMVERETNIVVWFGLGFGLGVVVVVEE
jgi:hypothetical protein